MEVINDISCFDVVLNQNWNDDCNENPTVKNRKQRNKNKFLNVFKTKENVSLPYLTVFQPPTYTVPYKEYLDSSTFCIVVPYQNRKKPIENHPFLIGDHALIHPSNINALQGFIKNNSTICWMKSRF